MCVAEGFLVRVTDDIYLHADVEAEMRRQVDGAAAAGAGADRGRDPRPAGTTRKYAVPLCEYLDRIGLTRRDGDLPLSGPMTIASATPDGLADALRSCTARDPKLKLGHAFQMVARGELNANDLLVARAQSALCRGNLRQPAAWQGGRDLAATAAKRARWKTTSAAALEHVPGRK